jgi:tripartite-type tricarboxylate transporter receptor subunit TctC
MMLGVASTMMPHVEAGRIKGLASASAQRPQIAPNLPTISEAALPGFESSVWFGLVAPAGTPRPVIDKLSAAANSALKSPDTVAKLKASGFEPLGGSPDEFAKFIAAETVKWDDAAKAAELRK